MKLTDVLPHFDGNKAALADRLGISRQAVSNRDPEKPIPENWELKLRYEILPEVFRELPHQ